MDYTESDNSKSALIVGGGNGLGAEIAKQIAKQFKNKKIIIADKTNSTALSNSEFINIDLSYESLDRLYGLDIDMLIVTAGIGRLSTFETFSEKEIEKNFSINTLPAIKLISAYYPEIQKSQSFYTCILSSITGVIASPLYSVYSASKASLVKFAEAVNAELEYYGYTNRILNVAPGSFSGTAFHGNKDATPTEELTLLAEEILSNLLERKTLFIPKKDETYGAVIDRYNANPREFAISSLKYKLEKTALNDKPQVKVGYLTGTFDLFHIGHLNLLKNAKKHCDKLIVGVHPTAKHKNKEVFIPLEERMEILKNIGIVDDVIVCSDEDIDDYPLLKYDYLFVGSDYEGSERFNRYEQYFADKGVKIIYLPYTKTTSSTQLRSAINASITKA